MSLYGITDTTICKNCFREFADHNYRLNSIDVYECPVPVTETGYGYFHGGDPRKFYPDFEDCSPDEIKRWKAACREADRLEAKRHLPCPSGWERHGDSVIHVLRAPFGIGTYTTEYVSEFEALESDEQDTGDDNE
jgi:hypothetical protein